MTHCWNCKKPFMETEAALAAREAEQIPEMAKYPLCWDCKRERAAYQAYCDSVTQDKPPI